jgi:hypothetical protein
VEKFIDFGIKKAKSVMAKSGHIKCHNGDIIHPNWVIHQMEYMGAFFLFLQARLGTLKYNKHMYRMIKIRRFIWDHHHEYWWQCKNSKMRK